MQTKSYIKLKQDVLVELTMDDTYLIDTDYSIINDALNSRKSFAYTGSDVNGTANQLYEVDDTLGKWNAADPSTQPLITLANYDNQPLYTYSNVRLYFPINFQFNSIEGFYLGVYVYDYHNEDLFWLSNFYIDLSNSVHFNMIENSGAPIRYQDKLWSKYVDVKIPSLYAESRKRTGSSATSGTINYNLTDGVGLSQTNPIFFDFRFIDSSYSVGGVKTYVLGTSGLSSCAQYPSYDNVSVSIKHATDGDYFEIFGSVQGSEDLFADFMQMLEDSGNKSYVAITVDVFEENVPTDSIDYIIYESFDRKIKFRPVLLYTSTTSYILVTMKVINTVDGSSIVKSASYGMLSDETSKYGRNISKINVKDVFVPKIVNTHGAKLTVSNASINAITRRTQVQRVDNVVYRSVPVLSSVTGIVIKDSTQTIGADKYYAQDDFECVVHPFDNVYKFKIAKEITKGSPVPLDIDLSSSEIKMVFKSSQDSIELPLYTQSNDVNIGSGIFVFALTEPNVIKAKRIYNENNKFYIVVKNNEITTVLYSGRFIPSDSTEYQQRANSPILKTPPQEQQQTQLPAQTTAKPAQTVNQSAVSIVPNAGTITVLDPSVINISGNGVLGNIDLSALGFSSNQFTLVQ